MLHLGSWIPQAVTYSVNFTESGNHKNENAKSHHTDVDLRKKDGKKVAGLTTYKVTLTQPVKGSRAIGANLNIDWFVRRAAAERDPSLAALEAQHTPLLLKAWSEVQKGFTSGYSTRLGGWFATQMVGAELRNHMSNEASYQANTMDCPNCAHDYKKPY